MLFSVYFCQKIERKYTQSLQVKSQNACSMQIIQELPSNKPNFPLKYTEDLNQTHVGVYEPIVFNDNISFYFNSPSSVQNMLKESHHGHIMLISKFFHDFGGKCPVMSIHIVLTQFF